MKKLVSAFVALSLALVVPAMAQAQTSTSRSDREMKRERTVWSNPQGLHTSSDIIGATVENKDGKNLGKIDALLFDPKDGKITEAVVGLGGFLGLGKDKVVVPYSSLTITERASGRKATVVADQAALESAPKYTTKASDRTPAASPRTDRSEKKPSKQ